MTRRKDLQDGGVALLLVALVTIGSLHQLTDAFNATEVPLGMESGIISDAQLAASSALTSHEPPASRLNSALSLTAWCPATVDQNQWLEVSFGEFVTLTAVSTQGRSEADEWTQSYSVSYKTYDFWQFYTDTNGIVQIFDGNSDRTTEVQNPLPKPVEAEKVRIHPKTFNGNMCLRAEFYGYRMGQLRPFASKLGIESGAIPDSQLDASSTYIDGVHTYNVSRSRLNMDAPKGAPEKGWCAGGVSAGEWLQVDLQRPMHVTAFTLQVGVLGATGEAAYLRTLTLDHSNDGINFESAKDTDGNATNFNGVQEFVQPIKTIDLPVPVFARYVRITAVDFIRRSCARWEIHGYRVEDMGEPLGIENGLVKDSQMTASSRLTDGGPERARLNGVAATGSSAWCSAITDDTQWLQVDLLAPTHVTAITVQGRGDGGVDAFVTNFTVSYGHNGYSWFGYKKSNGDLESFQGSYDNDTPVTHPLLNSLISARYIRVHPVAWTTAICMRIEIHGIQNSGYTEAHYDGLVPSPTSAMVMQSSTDFDAMHAADQGQLSNPSSAWRPADGDASPWLQVDLGDVATVTGVVTQGHPAAAQWTTGYALNFSEDSFVWDGFTTPMNLTSNYDQETQLAVMLVQPITARYVKILPTTYHLAVSLRVVLLGYTAEPLATTPQGVTTTTLSVATRIQMIQNAAMISEVYDAVVYNNLILDDVNQAALDRLPEILQGKVNWSLDEVEDTVATMRECANTAAITNGNQESFFEIMDRVLGVDISGLSGDQAVLNHLASDVMVSMERFAVEMSSNMATGQTDKVKTGQNVEIRIESVVAEDIDLSTGTLTLYDDVHENSLRIHLTSEQLAGNNDFKISTIKYETLHQNIGTSMENDQVNESQLWQTSVVSHVFSYVIIGDVVESNYVSQENPVYLNFKNTQETPEDHNDVCVFWKFDEGSTSGVWATTGCVVDVRTKTDTTCKCDHLTNFAVLMRVTPDRVISSADSMALELLTYIGTISSIISLLFAVLVYGYLRLLKIQRIIIHANLAISLALAQLIYISGIQATFDEGLCTAIAILLHYFFLVSFMWMLLEGIQLYTKSVHVFASGIRTWVFMVIGWGIPVVVVSISVPVRYEGYGSVDRCWLSLDDGLIWAFLAPVLFVISVNAFVLIMVIRVFMTLKANADKTEKERLKAGLRAVLMLQPLLGLTWLFGLLSSYDPSLLFNYLFVIFNSLQGVFVFLLHCLMNEEVRKTFRIHQKKLKSSVMSSSGTESSVITKTKLKPDYKSDLAKIRVEEKKHAVVGKEAWSES